MTVEDSIRATLRKRAEAITPADRWERIETATDRSPVHAGTPASRRLVAGVVAVAVFVVAGVFAWGAFRQTPSATSSATPPATPPSAASEYHDPAGWDVRVPEGWYAVPFTLISAPPEQFVGVVISDTELPTPTLEDGYPKAPSLGGLQPTVTALSSSSAAVIVARTVSPRSSEVDLPLSLATLEDQRAPKGSLPVKSANFAAAGSTFLVTVTTGSDAPDVSTLRIVDQILASFRYLQPATPTCLASQLTGRADRFRRQCGHGDRDVRVGEPIEYHLPRGRVAWDRGPGSNRNPTLGPGADGLLRRIAAPALRGDPAARRVRPSSHRGERHRHGRRLRHRQDLPDHTIGCGRLG